MYYNYKIKLERIMQNIQDKRQSTNLTSSKYKTPSLKHLLITLFTLLTFSITSTINTAIAGGRTSEPNLMDRFLQKQSSSQIPPALSTFSTSSTT